MAAEMSINSFGRQRQMEVDTKLASPILDCGILININHHILHMMTDQATIIIIIPDRNGM